MTRAQIAAQEDALADYQAGLRHDPDHGVTVDENHVAEVMARSADQVVGTGTRNRAALPYYQAAYGESYRQALMRFTTTSKDGVTPDLANAYLLFAGGAKPKPAPKRSQRKDASK